MKTGRLAADSWPPSAGRLVPVNFARATPCATACRSLPAPGQRLPAKQEGIALAVDGHYDKALKVFQGLLHDEPENAELNYLAGAACVRLDRLGEGIEYLEKSVKLKPGFPQAYGELAEACLKRKMKERARAAQRKGPGCSRKTNS